MKKSSMKGYFVALGIAATVTGAVWVLSRPVNTENTVFFPESICLRKDNAQILEKFTVEPMIAAPDKPQEAAAGIIAAIVGMEKASPKDVIPAEEVVLLKTEVEPPRPYLAFAVSQGNGPVKAPEWTARYEKKSDIPAFKKIWKNWSGDKNISRKKLEEIALLVQEVLPNIDNSADIPVLIAETAVAESAAGGDKTGLVGLDAQNCAVILDFLQNGHKDVFRTVMKFYDHQKSMKDNIERNLPFAMSMAICEYWRKEGAGFEQRIGTREDRERIWKKSYHHGGDIGIYSDRNDRYDSFDKNTPETPDGVKTRKINFL